jgi:hypothetical protein
MLNSSYDTEGCRRDRSASASQGRAPASCTHFDRNACAGKRTFSRKNLAASDWRIASGRPRWIACRSSSAPIRRRRLKLTLKAAEAVLQEGRAPQDEAGAPCGLATPHGTSPRWRARRDITSRASSPTGWKESPTGLLRLLALRNFNGGSMRNVLPFFARRGVTSPFGKLTRTSGKLRVPDRDRGTRACGRRACGACRSRSTCGSTWSWAITVEPKLNDASRYSWMRSRSLCRKGTEPGHRSKPRLEPVAAGPRHRCRGSRGCRGRRSASHREPWCAKRATRNVGRGRGVM